tara:strand:- start:609 stop:965 length:357 start_codon:yes stop_codon:yes gene_type:complete
MIRRDLVDYEDGSNKRPKGKDDFQTELEDVLDAVSDVLKYLAGELVLDRGIMRTQKALTRMGFPRAAGLVAPVAIGAQLGYAVGSYAGERSKGGTWELYNPSIANFEESALAARYRII